MKRSFRRISAVIATMAFTTGLAACGSSQSTAPSANKATSSVTAPQGWKKFTSKDLGYSVYFPGVPEKDTYKDPTGAYARYSTVNDKDHINYAVSVTKFTRKQVEDSKGFNDAQKRKVLTNVARLLQIDKYSFTTVDGHMAISYTGRDSEDSSVIMRREVVYSSAGLYGLESFGTSSSEYKQFVDTFRLSEDTQEWKEGLHDLPLALPTPRGRPPRIGWLPSWGSWSVWPSSPGSSPPSSASNPGQHPPGYGGPAKPVHRWSRGLPPNHDDERLHAHEGQRPLQGLAFPGIGPIRPSPSTRHLRRAGWIFVFISNLC